MSSSRKYKTARRIDRSNWLVYADSAFLVSSHRDNTRMFVAIGEVEAADEEIPTMVIKSEVWSGSVDTVQPSLTLQNLVRDFANCEYLDSPVEMVYEWGGVINHEPVTITNQHRESIQ